MKKLFAILLMATVFTFKPHHSSAQLSYNQGYEDGYKFAIERCLVANESHPEWAYSLVPKLYSILGVSWTSYTLLDNEGQAATLAVNYVHASYYSGITDRRTINVYYGGYYDGYLQGTADFVINL